MFTAGDREATGDFLLGQRFGAGQPFLEPRDGGGVARVPVGMRPAEITDATRHIELAANAEIHTTLPPMAVRLRGLPDFVNDQR